MQHIQEELDKWSYVTNIWTGNFYHKNDSCLKLNNKPNSFQSQQSICQKPWRKEISHPKGLRQKCGQGEKKKVICLPPLLQPPQPLRPAGGKGRNSIMEIQIELEL